MKKKALLSLIVATGFSGLSLVGTELASAQTPLIPSNSPEDIRLLDEPLVEESSLKEGDGPEGSVFTPRQLAPQEEINPAQAAPMRLVPRSVPAPTQERPTPLPTLPTTEISTVTSSGIVTGDLGMLDVEAVGTLRSDNGGFGIDMWRDVDRKTISSLIQRLPTRSPSPAMQDLHRRLLLSTAALPVSDAGEEGDNILSERVEALIEAGMLSDASALLETVPAQERQQEIYVRLKTDVFLLDGEYAKACQLADEQLQKANELYWVKLSALCHIINENTLGAEIAVNLVREQDPSDAVFLKLVDGLITKSPSQIESLLLPSPLQVALMRIGNTPYPADAIIDADTTVQALVAASAETDSKVRLNAGYNALASGSVVPKTVAQLMTQLKAEDLTTNINAEIEPTEAEVYGIALKEALLLQDLQERAKLIKAMVDRSRLEGAFEHIGRLLLPVVEVYNPTDDLLWFAPTAARVLAYNGEYDAVRSWYSRAKTLEAQGRPEGIAASIALWPLMVLMPEPIAAQTETQLQSSFSSDPALIETSRPTGSTSEILSATDQSLLISPVAQPNETSRAVSPSTLIKKRDYPLPYNFITRWQTSLSQRPAPQQARLQGTLISLFEALGMGVPTEALDRLSGLNEQPVSIKSPIATWRSFLAMTDRGRVGPAVALALISFGDDGALRSSGMLGPSIVNGLTVLELDTEARKLAVEIALGAGV